MTGKKRILFRFLVLPFLVALLMPFTVKDWMFEHHFSSLYYFLISFGISFGLIPIMYKVGTMLDITDKPGGRHIHMQVTPRTGGIAIFIAFITGLNLITIHSAELRAFFFASIIIGVVGILDDIRRLPALIKLIGQILAATILIANGFIFSFIPDESAYRFFSILLTYVWIIGITNAFNFLDGLDGLCAGVAVVVLLFYAIISNFINDTYMLMICMVLAGSVLGFLLYNFRPRKRALLFLGDMGSTFIGFSIAALSIFGHWGYNKFTDLAIPIILLAVPITDMTLATVVRLAKKKVRTLGQLLKYTGTDHFHHRLMHLGLSAKTAVIIIYILTILMGLLCLLLWKSTIQDSLIALSMALIIFYLITAFMIYQEKRNGDIK